MKEHTVTIDGVGTQLLSDMKGWLWGRAGVENVDWVANHGSETRFEFDSEADAEEFERVWKRQGNALDASRIAPAIAALREPVVETALAQDPKEDDVNTTGENKTYGLLNPTLNASPNEVVRTEDAAADVAEEERARKDAEADAEEEPAPRKQTTNATSKKR